MVRMMIDRAFVQESDAFLTTTTGESKLKISFTIIKKIKNITISKVMEKENKNSNSYEIFL